MIILVKTIFTYYAIANSNVSANIAKIIIDKYSSIFELKKEMENNPNCLNDLRYTISNGSSRK